MKVSKKRLTQIVKEELKEADLRGTTTYENPEDEAPYGRRKSGFPRTEPISEKEQLKDAMTSISDLSVYMERHVRPVRGSGRYHHSGIDDKTMDDFIGQLEKIYEMVREVKNKMEGPY